MLAISLFILQLAIAGEEVPKRAPAGDTKNIFALTNDRNKHTTLLNFDIEADGKVAAVRWSGEVPKTFTPAQLAQYQVVEAQQGVDAVLIKANVGSESGEMTIKFVYNGIFRTYKECTFKLKRVGGQAWQAIHSVTGDQITAPHMLTRTIGIKTIEGICPKE